MPSAHTDKEAPQQVKAKRHDIPFLLAVFLMAAIIGLLIFFNIDEIIKNNIFTINIFLNSIEGWVTIMLIFCIIIFLDFHAKPTYNCPSCGKLTIADKAADKLKHCPRCGDSNNVTIQTRTDYWESYRTNPFGRFISNLHELNTAIDKGLESWINSFYKAEPEKGTESTDNPSPSEHTKSEILTPPKTHDTKSECCPKCFSALNDPRQVTCHICLFDIGTDRDAIMSARVSKNECTFLTEEEQIIARKAIDSTNKKGLTDQFKAYCVGIFVVFPIGLVLFMIPLIGWILMLILWGAYAASRDENNQETIIDWEQNSANLYSSLLCPKCGDDIQSNELTYMVDNKLYLCPHCDSTLFLSGQYLTYDDRIADLTPAEINAITARFIKKEVLET